MMSKLSVEATKLVAMHKEFRFYTTGERQREELFELWNLSTRYILQALRTLQDANQATYRWMSDQQARVEILEKLAGKRNVQRATRHADNLLDLPPMPEPPGMLDHLHQGTGGGWSRKHQAEAIRLLAERMNHLALQLELMKRGVEPTPAAPRDESICNQCGHGEDQHGMDRCHVAGCDCNLNATSVQAGLGGPY